MDYQSYYRDYIIKDDGGFGFYKVIDPLGNQVATCEGLATAREIVDEKIERVYNWYERTSNLSPLQALAAAKISSDQAQDILDGGQIMVGHYVPGDDPFFKPWDVA